MKFSFFYLFTFTALICSAQTTSFGIQPGATFMEAGDMWGGQFSLFIERDLNKNFSLGGIIEGMYGTEPGGGLSIGDETIITNRGTSYFYHEDAAEWQDGFWQIEGSTTKQMNVGIGPRLTYHLLPESRHSVNLSIDILFRYNDQMYEHISVSGYSLSGNPILIAAPIFWTYFDFASSLSIGYTYHLSDKYFIGAFGRIRASMDLYQYASFGLTSGCSF